MSSRSDRVRAGIFVLVSLALLAGILVVVAGLRLFGDTRVYYANFEESVAGLEESSTVRYNGVPVGRVAHIGFVPDRFPTVQVRLEVNRDVPVMEGTVAVLRPQGITGINYVDLEYVPSSGAARKARALPEGATIPTKASITVELFDTIADLGGVVREVNRFLSENREELSSTVTDIREGAASARSAMEGLDRRLGALTEDLRTRLDATVESAKEALDAIRDYVRSPELQALPTRVTAVLGRAESVLERAEEAVASADVKGTLLALQKAIRHLEESASEIGGGVGRTLAEVRVGVAENRGNLMRILTDFAAFSRNLKLLSREIREDPSRVLFGGSRSGRREGE